MFGEARAYRTEVPSDPSLASAGNLTRMLAAKDILFRAGDRKTHVYRVETGAICLYDPRWNDFGAVVEFIFPGELVGLGFLDSHVFTARAFVETRVSCLSPAAAEKIAASDPKVEAKRAGTIEREFEAKRELLTSAAQSRKPADRVASLLLMLSANNEREGRDPNLIVDSWDCGMIASMLGLALDDLAEILIDLEKQDLIEPEIQGGLRLKDISALEALSEGPAEGSHKPFNYERRAQPPRIFAHRPAAV